MTRVCACSDCTTVYVDGMNNAAAVSALQLNNLRCVLGAAVVLQEAR